MASNTLEDTTMLELDRDNSVCVHLHGATVISWRYNGKEMLFVSSKAIYDNKKAIRGGIPICFPQFGPWEFGPQHGLARISRFELLYPPTTNSDSNGKSITAIFGLEHNEFTRSMWNFSFGLLYKVTLENNSLSLELGIENKGTESFSFTALLHPYFSVSNIDSVSVSGLVDLEYVDKNKNNSIEINKDEHIKLTGPTDKVFKSTVTNARIVDDNKDICIQIEKSSTLPDIVIWNPWSEGAKKMSDFGDDEFAQMICVEPGAVANPIILEGNKDFNSSVILRVIQK